MASSNYLIAFLQDVDILISEINRLESKARLYRKNCDIFDMTYDVKFSISPDSFVGLSSFLSEKIDENFGYDKRIADLRREFLRSFSLIRSNIQREIDRIEMAQKLEMNAIVYKAVYETKISNEVKIRDSFDVKSGLMDILLGVKKYRRLAYENHDLKASCLEREYAEKKCEEKSIFELVGLIENCEVKTGGLLCLEDDIIKAFMIDRSVFKKDGEGAWRVAMLIPHGFAAKREYYKALNRSLETENAELREKLLNDRISEGMKEDRVSIENLSNKIGRIFGFGCADIKEN